MALEWHAVTSAVYHAASADQLNSDYLYFLTDTGEIMKGSKAFTEAVIKLPTETLPTAPARNRLYILPSLEGKIYTGTEWVQVIKPLDSTVTETGVNAVTGAGVFAHVKSAIETAQAEMDGVVTDVTYDNGNAKLVLTKKDGSTKDVALQDFAVGMTYNTQTGALQLTGASGTALGSPINLDLERFVKAADYDHASRTITLYFADKATATEDDKITIDVGDLVDTYTAESSETITLTVTDNKFKAEAIVSATEGNRLQKTAQGLYVAPTDLSAYMKLVSGAAAGDMLTVDGNGQVVKAEFSKGGATLAETPAATVLATEAAVAAVRTALETSISSLADRVTALEGRMTTAEGDIDALEGRMTTAETNITNIQAQLTWKTTL